MATATTRTTSNTETKKVQLRLMIDKPAHKVLFAEAEKDFVDILFNLLYMPFGSVIRLLRNTGMVGCTGNLYQSLENLSEALVIPNQNKVELLKPLLKWEKESVLLQPQACPQPDKKLYTCGNYPHCVTTQKDTPRSPFFGSSTSFSSTQSFSSSPSFGSSPSFSSTPLFGSSTSFSSTPSFCSSTSFSSTPSFCSSTSFSSTPLFGSSTSFSSTPSFCSSTSFSSTPSFGSSTSFSSTPSVSSSPSFGSSLASELRHVNKVLDSEGGIVKKSVAFTVSDDLSVIPGSMKLGIGLLQGKFKEVIGALEERVVDIGPDEVLELLKTSLLTNEALSTVFLPHEERVIGMKII